MKPTLLILAAGMGSRYGGLKQIDSVGPSGEAIIDYSIFDAIRAGFGRVVFVIRKELEEDFIRFFGRKLNGRIDFDFVHQELNMVPENVTFSEDREKPWGTAHAVWVARETVHEPFAVINADDFYGAGSYQKMHDHLVKNQTSGMNSYCMIGYEVRQTLSEHGSVSRGICESNGHGFLRDVVERTEIEKVNGRIIYKDEKGNDVPLSGDALVSMNIWGFYPSVFGHLGDHFKRFIEQHNNDRKAELYIPTVVNELVRKEVEKVKILPADDQWFGVTYREDKPAAVEMIGELVGKGVYPENLWD